MQRTHLQRQDITDLPQREAEAGFPGQPRLVFRPTDDPPLGDITQVQTVGTLAIALGSFEELITFDPTVLEGNLLKHTDRQTLGALHRAKELPRLIEGIHGARAQPRIASIHIAAVAASSLHRPMS